jgi:hypothetical protein
VNPAWYDFLVMPEAVIAGYFMRSHAPCPDPDCFLSRESTDAQTARATGQFGDAMMWLWPGSATIGGLGATASKYARKRRFAGRRTQLF